jgi:hypothetical protein
VSYDLYFTSPKITLEQFESYFSDNPIYKVENSQAWYENEDTGVYFLFEHNDELSSDEDDIEHSVVFNMNYYRPHYFALEAEPEVRRFIESFSCSIHDYQNSGMGNGPYSKEGFLKGWNYGNDYGYSAILGRDDAPDVVFSKSSAELEQIWKWNYSRQKKEEEIQEDIFIPRIMFMLVNGKLGSVCIWPDGISTVIPSVDFLYVPRKVLAPKKWFEKQKDDFCILSQKDFSEFLKAYTTDQYELPAFKLPSPNTPKVIKDYVKNLKAYDGEIKGVGYDSVLNSEMVKKHRKGQQVS